MGSRELDAFVDLDDGLIDQFDGSLAMAALVRFGVFERRACILQMVARGFHIRLPGYSRPHDDFSAATRQENYDNARRRNRNGLPEVHAHLHRRLSLLKPPPSTGVFVIHCAT
jgi:hypothetical protein